MGNKVNKWMNKLDIKKGAFTKQAKIMIGLKVKNKLMKILKTIHLF